MDFNSDPAEMSILTRTMILSEEIGWYESLPSFPSSPSWAELTCGIWDFCSFQPKVHQNGFSSGFLADILGKVDGGISEEVVSEILDDRNEKNTASESRTSQESVWCLTQKQRLCLLQCCKGGKSKLLMKELPKMALFDNCGWI